MRPCFCLPGFAFLLATSLTLAGCDTAEERAEKHYQNGMALLAEGDPDRAFVEFRNVFRLNDDHVPALIEYAAILAMRGDIQGAVNHYLRALEIAPDTLTAHLKLAELLLKVQNFDTAEIHAAAAGKLAPEDPMVRALKATLAYRKGVDRTAAVALARDVVAETPANVLAQMVLIADRLSEDAPQEALAQVETALQAAPEDEDLHLARLAILERLGDTAGIGAQLGHMAKLFPENAGVREAQIQWHLQQNDPDAAEAVLRALADADPDNPEPALDVAQFLFELHGADAARAELERRIAEAEEPRPFQRALAGIDFTQGRTDAAIEAMRALLEDAEPSDMTRDLQATLAEMLIETGGAGEESAALLDAVLEGDRNHVAALKLRARMAIAADRPDAAVRDMRAALSRAPRDPEIMTIMALAHEREGRRELMGERLALAVEASLRAPAESLRYAAYLMQENRPGPAEGVVLDALRVAPNDPDLLNMLGRIHLAREDWARAGQVIRRLRDQQAPEADAMAAALETESLRGQGRSDDSIALLEEIAQDGSDAAAMAELVRAYLAKADPDAARRYLDGVLADNPQNIPARLLLADIEAATGATDTAETLYRELIAAAPQDARPYQALFTLLATEGRIEEAEAVLQAGIGATNAGTELRIIQAGILEARGDIDGATALYESLYAEDSGNLVVANNLASLLTGAGEESGGEKLDRAFAIARRLSTSDLPPFQDTYGWILHLRGEPARAHSYLEAAAEALPANAQVQFHRAEAEFALERWDAARDSFMRALEAHAAGSPLPQAETARARLAEIEGRRAPGKAPKDG